ncbi:MAG: hypothetical protein KAI02_07730, partial [Gammaproteobacteria bacterium]|nr:hypothetical protein [Gammaproteobacteria bacterium]
TLIQERDKNINNGKDLWRQCKTAYPHLKFCGKCPTQLQKWSHRVAILDQIKECLIFLNTYAEKMVKKQIKGYSHQQLRDHGLPYKVSGESPSVKNDRKKRQERMFYTTDGKEEFFENHIKLINGFRLHFFPDIKNGCIHIAHIGTHLKL